MEDSLDGGPPSVGSGEIPAATLTPCNSGTATPVSTKKVGGIPENFLALLIELTKKFGKIKRFCLFLLIENIATFIKQVKKPINFKWFCVFKCKKCF